MKIGIKYTIQWVDDPTNIEVIFKGKIRGFLIFENISNASIIRARPSSIIIL